MTQDRMTQRVDLAKPSHAGVSHYDTWLFYTSDAADEPPLLISEATQLIKKKN